MKRFLFRSAAVICLAGLSGAALGHAYVHMTHMPAGWIHDVEVRVPHGCGKDPTTEVRVKIPPGVMRVTIAQDPKWEAETIMRELDPPIDMGGGFEITQTVDEIVWRGSELPSRRFGRFLFRAMLPEEPDASSGSRPFSAAATTRNCAGTRRRPTKISPWAFFCVPCRTLRRSWC